MMKATSFCQMATTPVGRQEVEIIVWDDDNDTGIAYLPDLTMVGIARPGRYYETSEQLPDLTAYEEVVILYMRVCIATLDSDLAFAGHQYNEAHNLFGNLITEWSEQFSNLYNDMVEIYRAKTPKPTGHFRTKNVPFGLSSTEVKTWINDKVQPPAPNDRELLERFDQLINRYRKGQQQDVTVLHDASCWKDPNPTRLLVQERQQ